MHQKSWTERCQQICLPSRTSTASVHLLRVTDRRKAGKGYNDRDQRTYFCAPVCTGFEKYVFRTAGPTVIMVENHVCIPGARGSLGTAWMTGVSGKGNRRKKVGTKRQSTEGNKKYGAIVRTDRCKIILPVSYLVIRKKGGQDLHS